MKTVFTKFLALSACIVLMLAACKKDEQIISVDNGKTKAAVLAASSTTPALVKASLSATAVTFTATAPSYGYNAAVSNILQFDTKGDNFATPKKEVALPANTLTQAFTVQDLNNVLLGLGIQAGTSAQVEVRLKSSLSATVGVVYSNVVTLTATPFALASYVYVPGAYQGWTPATADSLQSATGNGIFTGIINFTGNDQHFKITTAKNFNVAYGDAGSGLVSTTGGDILAPTKTTVDPNFNIKSNLITVDLNKGTIAFTQVQWSVVGDATPNGWPNGTGVQSDTDLKFNNATQTWSGVVALKVGALKFRLNHDWGTSYGSLTNNGTLDTQNGNNIPITAAGNYLITLDISKLAYTITKQ